MCGFVGLWSAQKDVRELRPRLRESLASIRHRGPDGNGFFVAPNVQLAHARLSIIDLSSAAQQPMLDASGRWALVFNGEIYNFAQLAAEHLAHDESVNPRSDTSVLFGMYRRYGPDCLHYFNGMFAFAVVDMVEKRLFLARDRFGEKPLYFLRTDDCVVFASEIGAMRALLPERSWQIDVASVARYHLTGSVRAPGTIYRDVKALEPGSWFEIGLGAVSRQGRYWSIGSVTNIALQRQQKAGVPEDVTERVQFLLKNAVESRLVSDVPVGLFLSGGMDSGSIASLAHTVGKPVTDALCIDFEEARFSEYRLAKSTADRFGVKLHRAVVTEDLFMSGIGAFFAASDQPTTDGFNTYFVSKFAAALGTKVWLSGVGGDELFGGYPSFRRLAVLKLAAQILAPFAPKYAVGYATRLAGDNLKALRLLQLSVPGDAAATAYTVCRNTIPGLFLSQFMSRSALETFDITVLGSVASYPNTDFCTDTFQAAGVMETAVYMGSQLLRDMDNFSMTHSIELRAPFLDHRLYEYVFSLPAAFKQRRGFVKPLLADSLPHPLPLELTSGGKRGFTFPIETWMKASISESFCEFVFVAENEQFWNFEAIRRIWERYQAGQLHWSVPWSFYSLARWLAVQRELQ